MTNRPLQNKRWTLLMCHLVIDGAREQPLGAAKEFLRWLGSRDIRPSRGPGGVSTRWPPTGSEARGTTNDAWAPHASCSRGRVNNLHLDPGAVEASRRCGRGVAGTI